MKPAFQPTPLEIPAGFPHYHAQLLRRTIMYLKTGKARRKPAIRATLHRKGLVNDVSGLKRKGCSGTLIP